MINSQNTIDAYLESQIERPEEKKEPENERIERIAAEMERQIIRFTNIDKESFTHSFRGISITIHAGQSYIGRLPECDHLAIHLARKILAREKKAIWGKEKAGNLWTDEEIYALKQKILTSLAVEESKKHTTEEIRKQDLEKLQKEYTPVQVTKEQIIKDLENRGLKVDKRHSERELLSQLIEAEQAGIESKQ